MHRFRPVARRAACALLAAPLACSVEDALQRMTPPTHERAARAFLADLRRGDMDRAVAALAPAVTAIPGLRDSLASARQSLPAGPADTVRVVGVNRFVTRGTDRADLTYEIHTDSGWGLALISVAALEGASPMVTGVRTQRTAAPLAELNAFRLRGKGPGHLLVLLLAAVCAAFSLGAAVVTARTPMPRRWLWTFVALLGATRFTLDWTSGNWRWSPLYVEFFSAGVMRSGGVGPWLVSFGVPLGAILALRRVRAFRRRPAEAPAVAAVEADVPSR